MLKLRYTASTKLGDNYSPKVPHIKEEEEFISTDVEILNSRTFENIRKQVNKFPQM